MLGPSHRFARTVAWWTWLVACACDPGASSDEPVRFAVDPDATVRGVVSATTGGTLQSPTGIVLEVPPGALAADTELSLEPVLDAPRHGLLAAVRLGPDGQRFASPVTLRVPLAEPFPEGSAPLLGIDWDDLAGFGPTGELATLDATRTLATATLAHFCAYSLSQNCHSGTLGALLEGWAGWDGHQAPDVAAWAGVTADRVDDCNVSDDVLQRVLGQAFDALGDFPPGVTFDAAAQDVVLKRLAGGRAVVFLFGGALTPDPSSGDRLTGVAHSAWGVLSGSSVAVRNQVYLTNAETIAAVAGLPGNPTLVDVPLASLDQPGGLRTLRVGQMLEQVVGEPVSSVPVEERPLVWPHLRVYGQREGRWAGTWRYLDADEASLAAFTGSGLLSGPLAVDALDVEVRVDDGAAFVDGWIHLEVSTSAPVGSCARSREIWDLRTLDAARSGIFGVSRVGSVTFAGDETSHFAPEGCAAPSTTPGLLTFTLAFSDDDDLVLCAGQNVDNAAERRAACLAAPLVTLAR